jgi:hypothetical protein
MTPLVRHLRLHEYRLAIIINAVHGKHVLGEIDPCRYDAHGLALPWSRCDLEIPSWHSLPFAAFAATSGR